MEPPDLSLVHAIHRIVAESQPRTWILENVKGAQRWIGRAAWCRNPVYLWGEFPPIHCGSLRPWKQALSSGQAARRAEIPLDISEAVALSIEQALPFTTPTPGAQQDGR
jgi:hypothetical protein